MFTDYLKFIGLFVLFLVAVTLVLYPIDQFFPWFDTIVPFLKGISIFEFIKNNSALIFPILFVSFIGYVIFEAK